MKTERGNIYVLLALAIAVIGALAGLVIAGKNFVSGVDKKGYERGVQETTAAFEKRDNAQLQAANAAIERLEAAARKQEQDHAEAQAAIAATYEKELQDANARKDRDVAAARAGTLSLRFPTYGTRSGPAGGGAGRPGQAPAAPGGGDGGQAGELPRAVAADLLSLVDDADQVARQLKACQAVVMQDRAP